MKKLSRVLLIFDDKTVDELPVQGYLSTTIQRSNTPVPQVRRSEPRKGSPRKFTRYTLEDKEKLILLKEKGWSAREIARELGRSGDGSQINKYYNAHLRGEDILDPDFKVR